MKLSDRVEALTGPDRVVDCLVACAAHPTFKGEWRVVGPPTYEPERYFSGQGGINWLGYDLLNLAPRYTASLDAAMTLMPEGWSWSLGEMRGVKKFRGWLNDHNTSDGLAVRHVDADAATPVLALLAATLRARGL